MKTSPASLTWLLFRILPVIIAILPSLLCSGCATTKVAETTAEDIASVKSDPLFDEPLAAPVPSGEQYSAHNAYSLARVCYLIWQKHKGAIEFIADEKWHVERQFVDLRETDTQYVLVGTSEYTVLAFRATETALGDIITVLKFPYYETKSNGVYSQIPSGHAGFRASAAHAFVNGLIQDIQAFRRRTGAEQKNAPFFVTGHSLGGAVALMSVGKISQHVPVDSVYVYGAALALSEPFAAESRALFDRTFLHRYNGVSTSTERLRSYEHDNVPRLRGKSIDYRAPGVSFELHPDGHLEPYEQYQTLNAVTSVFWSWYWLTNRIWAHNLPRSYIEALSKALNAETQRRNQSNSPRRWWKNSMKDSATPTAAP